MLSRILARSCLLKSRGFNSTELQTQNEYILRLDVSPFTDKDLELCKDNEKLYLHGFREEQTGINNWKHSLNLVFSLPPTVQQETLQACFTQGVLEIKGLTNKTKKGPVTVCPPVKACAPRS